MTEYLKTLLHDKATSVDFRPPDLPAIRRAGDRRIVGRRSLVALAGVAVVAVTVGSVAVFGSSPDRSPQPGSGTAGVWAVGGEIHDGSDTIDAGHVIHAFVRTSAGFVTVDGDGAVHSVTSTGDEAIGSLDLVAAVAMDAAVLVSDAPGSLVGWVGFQDGAPVLVTYDQATDRFLERHAVPGASAGDVRYRAIDGRTGYFSGPAGLYAFDLDNGAETLLRSATAVPHYRLDSVENGMLAFARVDEPRAIFAGPSIEDAEELYTIPAPDGNRQSDVDVPVVLSPTGDWLGLSVSEFEFGEQGDTLTYVDVRPRVYDTRTGELVVLGLPDSTFGVASVWLTATTLQVLLIDEFTMPIAEDEPIHASAYACSVPDGSCELVADFGSINSNARTPDAPMAPDGQWTD
ncbi:MAG TPA: hypothetical protein VKB55_14180 [Nocardioidaceae bacterium]|nr:hypothetical protein [Nocardioidaceae bacterium]